MTRYKQVEDKIIELTPEEEAELNAKEEQVINQYKATEYIGERKAEYGTLEQQIENIIENGLEAEQARVQAIKDKYPKE